MPLLMQNTLIFFTIFFTLFLFSHKAETQEGTPLPFYLKQENSAPPLSQKEFLDEVEKTLFEATNKIREEKKLQALENHTILFQAARSHSQDMLKRKYFSHFSPEGKSVLERIRKIKPDYDESCGENLHNILSTKKFTDPQAVSQQMIKDWMNSPSHRKNILSKDYHFLSIACSSDGREIYCTQVFSGPRI